MEHTPGVNGAGGVEVTHSDVLEDGGEANGELYDPELKIYKRSSQQVNLAYGFTAQNTHFAKNQSPPTNTPTANQQRVSV